MAGNIVAAVAATAPALRKFRRESVFLVESEAIFIPLSLCLFIPHFAEQYSYPFRCQPKKPDNDPNKDRF